MTSNGHTITVPGGYPILFPGFVGDERLAKIASNLPEGTKVEPCGMSDLDPEAPREMTAPEHELLSRRIGWKRAAWAFYQHWMRAYRHNNPDEERGDFGLFGVFAEEMTAREMKRRESDPKYRHLCQ